MAVTRFWKLEIRYVQINVANSVKQIGIAEGTPGSLMFSRGSYPIVTVFETNKKYNVFLYEASSATTTSKWITTSQRKILIRISFLRMRTFFLLMHV